ncbi:uncharacterized protein LOC130687446 [Daphnia carinata]|uniref:uncharacterized protein LOC130687446 n=1 Tax=Daphnia carinata TaxID=120202 RepID=UPI00257F5E70|nr:uncharacterized protein LOC130687446 [Daphnia carinata]
MVEPFGKSFNNLSLSSKSFKRPSVIFLFVRTADANNASGPQMKVNTSHIQMHTNSKIICTAGSSTLLCVKVAYEVSKTKPYATYLKMWCFLLWPYDEVLLQRKILARLKFRVASCALYTRSARVPHPTYSEKMSRERE